MKIVVEAARKLLMQNEMLVANMSQRSLEGIYTQHCSVIDGTIGGHIMDSLQHYVWCITAIESEGEKVAAYDKRDLCPKIGTDMDCALDTMFDLSKRLSLLPLNDIPVKVEFNLEGKTNSEKVFLSSSMRQLWFVAHHALHQQAMIRLILTCLSDKSVLADTLPINFGVAPATILFRESQKL